MAASSVSDELERELLQELESSPPVPPPPPPPAIPPPPVPPPADDVVFRHEVMIRRALVDFGDECFDRIICKLQELDVSLKTRKLIDEKVRQDILGPLREC